MNPRLHAESSKMPKKVGPMRIPRGIPFTWDTNLRSQCMMYIGVHNQSMSLELTRSCSTQNDAWIFPYIITGLCTAKPKLLYMALCFYTTLHHISDNRLWHRSIT